MLGVIVGFVAGVGVGVFYARFRATSTSGTTAAESSARAGRRADGQPAPNKRARKAGLTEADFTPSDDILERLRLVEAGELDPEALRADEDAEFAEERAQADPPPAAPAAPDPAAMTDAERRVLDRLRRMAGEDDVPG